MTNSILYARKQIILEQLELSLRLKKENPMLDQAFYSMLEKATQDLNDDFEHSYDNNITNMLISKPYYSELREYTACLLPHQALLRMLSDFIRITTS